MQVKRFLMQQPVTALVSSLGLALGVTGIILLSSAKPSLSSIFSNQQNLGQPITPSQQGNLGAQISSIFSAPSGNMLKGVLLTTGGVGIVAGTAFKRKLKRQQPVLPLESSTPSSATSPETELTLSLCSFPVMIPLENNRGDWGDQLGRGELLESACASESETKTEAASETQEAQELTVI
jgi:hypothetical protein